MRKLTLAVATLLPSMTMAHPGPEAHWPHLMQHALLGAVVLGSVGLGWVLARRKR